MLDALFDGGAAFFVSFKRARQIVFIIFRVADSFVQRAGIKVVGAIERVFGLKLGQNRLRSFQIGESFVGFSEIGSKTAEPRKVFAKL